MLECFNYDIKFIDIVMFLLWRKIKVNKFLFVFELLLFYVVELIGVVNLKEKEVLNEVILLEEIFWMCI